MNSSNKKEHRDANNVKEEEVQVEIKPLITSQPQQFPANEKETNFHRRRSSGVADAARSGKTYEIKLVVSIIPNLKSETMYDKYFATNT